MASRQTDRDVLCGSQNRPAVAIAQPAKIGQEDAAVGLIEVDLIGVWVAKAVALVLLLEAWEVSPFGDEVLVGTIEVFELVLRGCTRAS